MSLTNEVCGHLKRCSKCGVEKPLSDFYKKGVRIEAKCKPCLKEVRAQEYWRKRKRARLTKCRIAKVNVIEVKPKDLEQYKREMQIVETIFENLIYKVLSKKLAKGA